MREDWWADGWLLTDGLVRDVQYRTGLYKTAALRGENAQVANRRGALWRPKMRDVGAFTLSMWLGDTSRANVEAWWDLLIRATNPGHRLVKYTRNTASGGSRYCLGEIVSAIEPVPAGNLLITCGLEVQVPDGVWWDNTSLTGTKTNTVAFSSVPTTLPLTNFANVTTEQHDLIVTITGPVQNPKVYDITDGVDGSWFAYDAALTAGQTLTVNCSTWAITTTGGLVNNPAKLRYNKARYLVVPPAPPLGTPTLQIRGDSAGAGASLSVTGTPAFAC